MTDGCNRTFGLQEEIDVDGSDGTGSVDENLGWHGDSENDLRSGIEVGGLGCTRLSVRFNGIVSLMAPWAHKRIERHLTCHLDKT